MIRKNTDSKNVELKNEKFREWLKEDVVKKYDFHSVKNYKNIDIINKYICDILDLLKKNKYTITNLKEFKDEIASYIYNNNRNDRKMV